MSELHYRAYDADGSVVKGTLRDQSPAEVLTSMQHKGLYLVELSAKAPKISPKLEIDLKGLTKYLHKVKTEEIIIFTRQFYTLFKAGLSVDVLLSTLQKQAANPALKAALLTIHQDIQNGSSMSKAFAKHPHIFSPLYISMVTAGEEAGIMEQALSELNQVLEKDNQLSHEIKSATLYPKIVISVMGIAMYVMTSFVLPKFSAFFGKFHADLPLPTRILIGVGDFSNKYWYVVFACLFGFLFAMKAYGRTARGALHFDTIKLKLPIFGLLHRKIAMARFGHLFSALYRSGMPLVRTFEILARVIGNEVYRIEIEKFREGILKGKSIAEVMRHSKNFVPIMIETTAIGEQSGNLDTMLTSMATHFDLEIRHITKNLTTLLEPILLVMMFGMVTIMALGVFLPMWNMSKVVMKH